MCRALTPDYGYDNGTIILIGDVYCPNTKCSGRLCLHKNTLNLSAEPIINARNARLCVRCAIILLKIKEIPNSCRLAKGLTFLKRNQNQFKMLLERFFVLASIVSTEKCESVGGYVTNPRSIQGCGKCGAWLFVHKAPFTLQEQENSTKTDKTRFFLPKRMNLLPEEHLLLTVFFQSTKYRKKDLCVDNKIQETIGDVYCPTCRNEKRVYISTNKTTSFYDCQKCEACCHVLNTPFKDQ